MTPNLITERNMPNIATVLKDEITRLVRKETKAEFAALKKENSMLRKELASLKKEIAKYCAKPAAAKLGRKPAAVKAKPVSAEKVSGKKVTGKAIKRLREKFGLSQSVFATLMGLTGQTVYQWEKKSGPIRFRGEGELRYNEIKNLGKKEAHKLLEDMGVNPKSTRGRRKK